MNVLERRCRFLLRAYPQPYRADRGEEIMATLVEVAPPGRTWPSAREAWSLVAGGIKVRGTANRQLPLAASLRLAGLLAAALAVGLPSALYFFGVLHPGSLKTTGPVIVLWAASAVGPGLAVASAWFWPRGLTVALALATATASMAALELTGDIDRLGFELLQIVPSLALAALAAGKHRPPRSWLWLPALWLAVCAITGSLGSPSDTPLTPIYIGFLIVVGLAVMWAVTDARPAIAVGLAILASYLANVLLLAGALGHPSPDQALILALILAALATAIARARQTAKSLDPSRR